MQLVASSYNIQITIAMPLFDFLTFDNIKQQELVMDFCHEQFF